jgi:hypothetical protein
MCSMLSSSSGEMSCQGCEQLCTPVQSQTVTLLDTQYRICGKCVQALIPPITSAGYAITGVLSVHTAKFSPAALQMWRRELTRTTRRTSWKKRDSGSTASMARSWT